MSCSSGKGKEQFFYMKTTGQYKATYRLCDLDKSLNLLNHSFFTTKRGWQHIKVIIVTTEKTRAQHLPSGRPTGSTRSRTCCEDCPCSWPTPGTSLFSLPVLTFCLVLSGCDFSFSSLLLEILRNCLRSP